MTHLSPENHYFIKIGFVTFWFLILDIFSTQFRDTINKPFRKCKTGFRKWIFTRLFIAKYGIYLKA